MGEHAMALRHVTTAALAAGLTMGALLAMPDAPGRAADGATPVTASAATLRLPTPHVKTLAAVPSTAAAPTTSTAEPAPVAAPSAAPQPVGEVSALTASGIPETGLDAYRQGAAGAPCS